MTKVLMILIVALVVEALGVVLITHGLRQLGQPQNPTEIARVIGKGLRNRDILAGIALEAIFFGMLLYLLSQRDVSLIWPLTSLGFVITALAARFLLGEQVSPLRWLGVALIVIGAALVSVSEVQKTTSTSAPAQAKSPP